MISAAGRSDTNSAHRAGDSPPISRRGMTLIELMVVVSIIAILAGVAGVAYMRYVKQGEIAQLKQYAMEIEQGEKEYKARNGYYLDIDKAYYTSDTDAREKWEDLLGFEHEKFESLPIEAEVHAGDSTTSCGNCPSGLSPDTSGAWYAIEVRQDLDSSASDDTTIYLDNNRENPVLLHEGE
ncbi:MAG: type IV pilin protein [Bradymonadaceae bacterium]